VDFCALRMLAAICFSDAMGVDPFLVGVAYI